MPGQVLNTRQRARIIAALKANPNAARVARQIGNVSAWTVGQLAKAAGIPLTAGLAARRRPLTQLPPAQHARVVTTLKVTHNAAAAARQLRSVTYRLVWQIAKREGVVLIPPRKVTPEMRTAIVAALRADPNSRRVARKIGDVSHVTVGRIAREEGIRPARGRRRNIPKS